jgi:NADH-quinone oxidoreductase subunit M
MNDLWTVPWLEIAIALPVLGAVWVSRFRDPVRAFVRGLGFSGATFACAALACLAFYAGAPPSPWSAQSSLFGRPLFGLDELSAPLVALVALLHFLTALATGRTKMRRFALSWSLAYEALRLAIFGCKEPWLLVGLLIAGTLPGYLELRNRRKPRQVYVLHMGLFAALLVLGWGKVNPDAGPAGQTAWALVPLLAAILIRCGTLPVHCWVTDWFEHASFGNGLLFVAPLTGVYAAVRLVLPIAPGWVLSGIGLFALVTAVYAAAMAVVQQETRRCFAYLFLSHASLVLVGLELQTVISLTGALCLWISVSLSLAGLGLTLRALEARVGRLSLASFHGFYEQSPMLAMCFGLTGLASVGFPGTLGFVATEIVVDGAVAASPWVGLGVVVAAAINGIAIVRMYFLLFTGARRASTVSLKVGVRERLAVLTLAALILGGGFFPQPGVASRHRAAVDILRQREGRGPAPAGVAGNAGGPPPPAGALVRASGGP